MNSQRKAPTWSAPSQEPEHDYQLRTLLVP